MRVSGGEGGDTNVKRLLQCHPSQENAGRPLPIFDNANDLDLLFNRTGNENVSLGMFNNLLRSCEGGLVFTIQSTRIAVKFTQPNVIEVLAMEEDTAKQMVSKLSRLNYHQQTVDPLNQLTPSC